MDEEIQRWTAKRRKALVLSIIKGETSAQEAARKHGLTVAEVEKWLEPPTGVSSCKFVPVDIRPILGRRPGIAAQNPYPLETYL